MDFLAAGGEMAERIRQFDWSRTPLGGIESWSPALRTMVQFILANGFPQLLWWGPEYIQFYNDPYRPIPGAKHPHIALGRPARECWSEIFHIIGPLIDTPFHGGPATWDEDILLEINRHGYLEESHFTIAYSPVPDETVPGGIGGVLATVHEITGKVVGERRIEVLRDLGARASDARTAEDASVIVADTLARHGKDVPFAMLYLVEPESGQARLAGVAGVEAGDPICPRVIDLAMPNATAWPLDTSGALDLQVVEGLQERFASVPPGPWSDAPRAAVVVPIPATKQQELAGFLIVGVSARLGFDQAYRGFLELMRTQVASTLANARAYDEERRRAEELAALDLAKTRFFSNVSHEFRTPLTLMLGPVEDVLGDPHCVTPEARKQLQVAHRNSLRLLRLVNTMLEFTRIEAGRAFAHYAPVDLPELTAELASSFRSACERAGLHLVINCPPLPMGKQAFVDVDMWEKVVLNLLSNAFKFTLEGEIEVRLEASSSREIRLVVRDTGLGIPAEELPRMFDRFHRIHNAAARTHEGTGIGLALVHELAKLHGGTVAVDSVLGEGSTFTVSIPLGKDHLDHAHVQAEPSAPHRLNASVFVEEAMRWLPDIDSLLDEDTVRSPVAPDEALPGMSEVMRPRIVWADDNTDMRLYVARLLSERYDVEAVADGRSALEAARREAPDLVLTDVMMPHMDGFELIRELRATEGLKEVPVIMVSARAGEESRIVGLEAGADDYLIKPFSARELVARVDAHLRVVLLRRAVEAERRESEAQINRANDELNDRVVELERANREVQESRKTALSLMVDALLAKEQLRDADRR
ncbi:MAG TPA: response regulator, partial [Gemmatimonadaceae bacterium]|nr:response regulator [Gemmatimonadaceae bacterium]